MTTKVLVSVPKSNHKRVNVTYRQNPLGMVLDQGENHEFYVYKGQELTITEIDLEKPFISGFNQ